MNAIIWFGPPSRVIQQCEVRDMAVSLKGSQSVAALLGLAVALVRQADPF